MSKEDDDDRVGLYGSRKALAEGQWNEVVWGLGLVSVEFQRLESAIKMAIWELVAKAEPLIGALITPQNYLLEQHHTFCMHLPNIDGKIPSHFRRLTTSWVAAMCSKEREINSSIPLGILTLRPAKVVFATNRLRAIERVFVFNMKPLHRQK